LPRRHNDTHSVCHNGTLPGPLYSVTARPDARSCASAQQNESHHPPRMNGNDALFLSLFGSGYAGLGSGLLGGVGGHRSATASGPRSRLKCRRWRAACGLATSRRPPPFPCLRPRRELVSGVARCSCNEYY
jgi:hypothetical protein